MDGWHQIHSKGTATSCIKAKLIIATRPARTHVMNNSVLKSEDAFVIKQEFNFCSECEIKKKIVLQTENEENTESWKEGVFFYFRIQIDKQIVFHTRESIKSSWVPSSSSCCVGGSVRKRARDLENYAIGKWHPGENRK